MHGGRQAVANEVYGKGERSVAAGYQHGHLELFGEARQERFERVQHGAAGVGHIVYQYDHFTGKISFVRKRYFFGGLFIQLYLHHFNLERSNAPEVLRYFMGENGTTVPDAYQDNRRLI